MRKDCVWLVRVLVVVYVDLLGTCAGCDTKTLVRLCKCALGRVGYECVLDTINGGKSWIVLNDG
jgi:hypothetical protein